MRHGSADGAVSALCSPARNGKRAVAYRRIEGIPDEWGNRR
jgi:hypothetical protein